jgi:aspartate carbamoyltransferase catalytic subunit
MSEILLNNENQFFNDKLTEVDLSRYEADDYPDLDYSSVMLPVNGNPKSKNLLSALQLTERDYYMYLKESYAAERIYEEGMDILPRQRLYALMRQPSTRTGGGFAHAMTKLGGSGVNQGGAKDSSEAKEETRLDSEVAFDTQCDIYAIRTAEDYGPAFAALAINQEYQRGNLTKKVPVINAGDGKNEHITQTLGDFFTIHKRYNTLKDLNLFIYGDLERYRAFHSLVIGAATVGMNVVVVESRAAPLPGKYVDMLGDQLIQLSDFQEALEISDILYPGRRPKEYSNEEDRLEQLRNQQLISDYERWKLDEKALQIFSDDGIIMHARPRGFVELPTCSDNDPRRRDVSQMEDVVKSRMGVLALHMGKSIVNELDDRNVAYNNPLV